MQAERATGTRVTLADSASSAAALGAPRPPQNLPSHSIQRDESVSQHVESVPNQPASVQQRFYGAAAALTDGSEDETAVEVDEKVERGVTAANDGRRSVKSLPVDAALVTLCNASSSMA